MKGIEGDKKSGEGRRYLLLPPVAVITVPAMSFHPAAKFTSSFELFPSRLEPASHSEAPTAVCDTHSGEVLSPA